MSIRFSLCFLVLTALVGSPFHACALPPLARRAIGKIEDVDRSQHKFVFRGGVRLEAMALRFDHQTRVWRDSETTTPDALTRGQTVQVSYRLPFVGPAYASRIVIISPAKSKTETRKPNRHNKL